MFLIMSFLIEKKNKNERKNQKNKKNKIFDSKNDENITN